MMLPVATASASAPIQNDADRLPRARDGESVLLVDDEADLRAICSQWAESLGYRVAAVASPSDALDRLGAQHFDALITDVVMPGSMDGASLAAAVRKRQPSIAVLLISGYADGSIDQSARHWRLLEKPFRRDQLAHELRAAIDEMVTARH
jgi:CheY-like chemotaxis protein